MRNFPFRLFVVFLFVVGLAGCQSSEERAEEHYQSALALLAEGDLERATVEFRNVFELNPTHIEARRSYAEANREAGQFQEAYGQFLRLVEQRPDDVEGRIALAQMAIEVQNWEEVRRHGERAAELAAEDPRLVPISATMDYAAAIEATDDGARRDAADAAALALESDPDNLSLHRIVIDSALRDGEQGEGLERIEAALAIAPDNRDLHNTRLALLAQSEDADAVAAQLIDMVARFPDDPALTSTLLRFYTSRGEVDAAEAFLRARIAEAPPEDQDIRVTLVRFLQELRSPEDALAELETMIDSAPDTAVYQLLQAGIRFDIGEREAAITSLQSLIDAGVASPSELNNIRIELARMLSMTGNAVGARRLVGEVLEADAANVAALRLEANWLIDEDRADAAIARLRTALNEAPDDILAMTLMARAHQRNGSSELARDFLALAYDASGAAPAETLRYAQALIADELYLPAEEALVAALRIAPTTTEILAELGRVYILMEDWPRAEQVERRLRDIGTDGTVNLANGLQAARLAAQGRMEETVAFLETLSAQAPEGGDLGLQITLVRSLLTSGDHDRALSYARDAAAEAPDNLALLLLLGSTEAAVGETEAAEATYRRVIEIAPQVEQAWVALIQTLYAQGRIEDAETTLAAGLEALPEGVNLLWAQATFLERAGDFEGAIATYETLYDREPENLIVANNLASMISAYRNDDESLERAYAIARRLRGTDVPQFQDTYGWIAFRRGDLDEARSYLESAAAALTEDPLAQFHYGMFLAADGQTTAAIEQLTLAIDVAGPEDTRPQLDIARAEIARLETLSGEGEEATQNQ